MEDLKLWSVSLNQDFGKGKGQKLIVGKCKSNLGDVLSELVYSNVSQTGVWGQSPQPPEAMSRWAIFVSFWKKKLF